MKGVALYTATQPGAQDELVTRHAPLVKRIAYHLMTRLPPSVQVDDLIQAGLIGLLEAARHYDASQGASFETYAGIRVRGAMLDEVRKTDWAPRSVHRKARMISDAVRAIENRVGRHAQDHEVATALDMSLHDYHQMLQDASGYSLLSLDAMAADDEYGAHEAPDKGETPLESLQNADFRQTLAAAIEDLPERERLVIALYYDDELNLREIGAVLEVSESRVSQIHTQAMLRLRAHMERTEQDAGAAPKIKRNDRKKLRMAS
ncbi:MAG: RNA polymerase sigma factor FliA [Gammaproteobacteria bacterium]|nr:RNA polymerase sigma factor FliA [Gammaproteobacteria bacterium]